MKRVNFLPAVVLSLFLIVSAASLSGVDLTTAALDAFFGGLVPLQLQQQHIAGAVVTVVHRGEVVFSRGYGYADLEHRRPMDPSDTLVRIGSITKLCTATVVMQLVEQGSIDLDADIERYLEFPIARAFDEPVTMRHLLTHTAGFEDRGFGTWVQKDALPLSLASWFVTDMPEQVRRPGSYAAYSNYGFALAGHIASRVSGMDYDTLLERSLFSPLMMDHTSSAQPIPETLQPLASLGYRFEQGRYVTQDLPLLLPAPAGSVYSTAEDMSRFMIMQLQSGRYAQEQLLLSESAAMMQSVQFKHDQNLHDGMALGFYETHRNGVRVIGHGGDTLWFHSRLALIPSHEIGLFVSFNSAGSEELGTEIVDTFTDHFLCVGQQRSDPFIPADTDMVSGTYRMNRMSFSTPERLMQLFSTISIEKVDAGTILLDGPKGPELFRAVAPMVYEREGSTLRLVFSEDEQGIMRAFLDTAPFLVFQRIPWYESAAVHLGIFAVTLVISLLWVVLHLKRRLFGTAGYRLTGWGYAFDLGMLGFSVFALALLAVMGVLISDIFSLMTGGSSLIYLLYVLPYLLVCCSLAAASGLIGLRWTGELSGKRSYLHVLHILITLTVLWSLWYWNILGGRF